MNTISRQQRLGTAEACGSRVHVPAWRRLPARLLARGLEGVLERMSHGSLEVHLPDASRVAGRGFAGGPAATLVLHRWRTLARLALRGDLGLAESYRDGDWSCSDLCALLELGIHNEPAWQDALGIPWPLRAVSRLAHLRRDNTREGSRRNIAYHYDLGNEFYRKWLDADLNYSSGLYRRAEATLEQAQSAKLERVLELLDLPPDASAHVLEVGCGWGALACLLAARGRARVTGVTLSAQQLAHGRDRVARKRLEAQVDLRLQDYRDVEGSYDRIVSIEMIEAVGERHWPRYFEMLRERLRPGGAAVLQAITIADDCFGRYRRNPDFIQHFIFPGGMLPSPATLARQAAQAGLSLTVAETFGASYAATLAEWRRRFHRAWPAIAALGFDEPFRRLWEYYLCYCEAGFRCGRVDVGLYRLTPN